jgi:hypothetical protein
MSVIASNERALSAMYDAVRVAKLTYERADEAADELHAKLNQHLDKIISVKAASAGDRHPSVDEMLAQAKVQQHNLAVLFAMRGQAFRRWQALSDNLFALGGEC